MKDSFAIAAFGCVVALLAAPPLSAAEVPAGNGKAVGEAVADIEAEYASGNGDTATTVSSEVPLMLDEVQVIRLTARYSPRIQRAYERKLAEEARYDFFIYSREAFSYGADADFEYDRFHKDAGRSVEKTLSPNVFVRKEFYNTASASTSVGYDLWDYQSGHEGNAFAQASVSIPLFASREALARSNEKIYQQTEVNDARLAYYQQIRWQVSGALYNLSWAQHNQETLEILAAYKADLEEMLRVVSSITSRDTSADAEKVQATLATVNAEFDSTQNEFEISCERLKNAIGIAFDTKVSVSSKDFNPFTGEGQDELEQVAVETDEEIKTLLNSIKNAQAELELARKGKWDTSLSVTAKREFAGSGDAGGDADYLLATGVSVTRIDERISRSLEKVALARIRENRSAIVNRRREIHTDVVDAFKNLKGRTAEGAARKANLPKYCDDCAKGIELYKAGSITVDALLQKRESLNNERDEIVGARNGARESLVTLLAATGRYEQFLDKKDDANGVTGRAADKGPSLPARDMIEEPR
jgi:outer membrane protein TolC